MKAFWKILTAFVAISIGLIAALLAGCSSHPPTRFEQGLFTIQTNAVPVLIVRTNVILVTNVVGVTEYQTNVVTTVRTNESYVYARGPGAQSIVETGTAVGNLFGMGGVVGTGLGALFSLWGYIRSRKSLLTAGDLAQTVETMRMFVRSLPDGQRYDNELVNWMQQHQAESGVLNDVLRLLQTQVSNADAKVAAQQVMDTINALRGLQPPTSPPTV